MGDTGTSGTASGTETGTGEEPSSERVVSNEVTAGPTVGTAGKETAIGWTRNTNYVLTHLEFIWVYWSIYCRSAYTASNFTHVLRHFVSFRDH